MTEIIEGLIILVLLFIIWVLGKFLRAKDKEYEELREITEDLGRQAAKYYDILKENGWNDR